MTPITVISVNSARTQRLNLGGHRFASAIGKRSVGEQRVPVARLGLLGDEQADPSLHGGIGKAVYAYPSEHYPRWQAWREQALAQAPDLFGPTGAEPLPWGFLGENLTVAGLTESQVWVGDELHGPPQADGSRLVLRVTAPRKPCGKLVAVMGYVAAARDMVRHGLCGWYLAVEQTGSVAAGDVFTLRPGQRHLCITEAIRAAGASVRNG